MPIFQAWTAGSTLDPAAAWGGPGEEPYAGVLANREPPYAIRGGVRDVLESSGGFMYAVGSAAARQAASEFAASEGIDLEPAAAVAVASLEQAIAMGRVGPTELIVLNITGCGLDLLRRDFEVRPLLPDFVVDPEKLDTIRAVAGGPPVCRGHL